MDGLTDVGLGLDYDKLRIARTSQQWIDAGARLRDHIADELAGLVADVQQIGSSSVLGLLAKPIVDLVAGLVAEQELAPVRTRLEHSAWIYRGDAGANGGQVFVLEAGPWHRIAHLHVVDHDGEQWQEYLQLRDLLRRSATARARYEAVKQQLWLEVGDDRKAYTDGKSDIVRQLLHPDC